VSFALDAWGELVGAIAAARLLPKSISFVLQQVHGNVWLTHPSNNDIHANGHMLEKRVAQKITNLQSNHISSARVSMPFDLTDLTDNVFDKQLRDSGSDAIEDGLNDECPIALVDSTLRGTSPEVRAQS
jgi:hypothetical protein